MDESGDTGLHFGMGSSELFTIGMVLFPEEVIADACRVRIQAVRKELGMPVSGKESEFHFRDLGPERREAFFVAIGDDYPFNFYTSTIMKRRLSGRAWKKKEYMYHRAGAMVIDMARDNMLEAKLVFDATSGKKFDWEFLKFLTQHAGYDKGVPLIKQTQRLPSHTDDLVQLIDMIIGAVLFKDNTYLRLIRRWQGGRIVFPPRAEEINPGNPE